MHYSINRHRSAMVDPKTLPLELEAFEMQLAAAVREWQEKGLVSGWLELPVALASFLPHTLEKGFELHHCTKAYLLLTLHLIKTVSLPEYATHYIGAGGIVLNDAQELLVVVERAHAQEHPHYYKLPGGALYAGEHIADGVKREVQEETGIETEFMSLVCFRHWHGYRYGKSDIYFICTLKPLTTEIVRQEAEIHACQWMPVQEYLAHEGVGVFNKRIVEYAMKGKGLSAGWFDGYEMDPTTREIFHV